MIGWFSTAVIAAFQSSFFRWVVPFGGPLSFGSPVVFLDHRHSFFWNFYSTVPVDVVRVKSCVNRLFDPESVTVRITINKFYLIPKQVLSGVMGMF